MYTRPISIVLTVLLVTSCGGGGGGGSGGSSNPGNSSGWTRNVFSPSADFANQCNSVRTGMNPATDEPYPDMPGSVLSENNWLRSWINETYLWYDEVTDRDPALYSTADYFQLMKSQETTASGKPKDQFHFSLPTQEWIDSIRSEVDIGYGAHWTILSAEVPRSMYIAYTEPNTPVTQPDVALGRGARILEIDGIDFINDDSRAGVDALNEAIFPSTAGQRHSFTVQDFGSNTTRTVSMVSVDFPSAPVQSVRTFNTASGNVGYMAFHTHSEVSEQYLVNVITNFQGNGISDLILDLRYNGGGLLGIASQVAYMVAGLAATADKIFAAAKFNDKIGDIDPTTGQPLQPVPFIGETLGYSLGAGQGLPELNLPRLFVITGNNTCSASENIINGLAGIGFEVILIGGTTCGKPYGSSPRDNCGTTYFPIQIQTVNHLGFGDYADGFAPTDEGISGVVVLKGCAVEDDFGHELGDESEARLMAALEYRESGSCPGTISARSFGTNLDSTDSKRPEIYDGLTPRSPWVPDKIR